MEAAILYGYLQNAHTKWSRRKKEGEKKIIMKTKNINKNKKINSNSSGLTPLAKIFPS